MKKILLFTLFLMVASSCNKWTDLKNTNLTPMKIRTPEELFMAKYIAGIYNGGMYVFTLNKENCQLALNQTRKCFLLQEDDCSKVFSTTYEPDLNVGDSFMAQVQIAGIPESQSGEKRMKVVKKSSEMMWLWDENEQLGYLIYTSLDFL